MLRKLLTLVIPAAGLMASLQDPPWQGSRSEPLRLEGIPIAADLQRVREQFLAQCRKAAEAGDPSAQAQFGLRCYWGVGVPRDWAEARVWLHRASAQGRADAQYILGVMQFLGEGGPGSLAESLKWFRCAAEQGDANAQTCMGIMYCFGRGVPKDLLQAYVWLRQGEAGGNPDAARLCRQLRIWLSPAQIEEGDRLATEAMKRLPHGDSRGNATP